MANTFDPDTVIKRTKGKMIMLYAVVDGEETHMASFFHENKAMFVLDALRAHNEDIDIVDEDAPVKKKKSSTTKKKSTVGKKKK